MLLLVSALGFGGQVTARLRLPLGAFARLGVEIAVGLMALLWLPFLLALAFDASAAGAALFASGLLLLTWVPAAIARFRARDAASPFRLVIGRHDHGAAWTTLALLALIVWLHVTHYLVSRPDGLHSAGVTWGDLPIHFALASRFLYADGLPALEHPLYLGGALAYPFLPDYAVALSAAQGSTLRAAFMGGVVPLAGLCLLLHGLVQLWHGPAVRTSTTALVLVLFFLAGGLGAGVVVARLFDGESLLPLLASTNATYLDPHVLKSGHLGNLFVAARTASYGMALGTAALLLLGHAVQASTPPRAVLALCGVLVGSLPLVHGHSFVVLCFVVASYALIWRRHGLRWLWCLVPLALFALPQLAWLARTGAPSNVRLVSGFLRPAPNAGEWLFDVVAGVGLPLLLVPLALLASRREARVMAAPLLALLPLANVLTLTPSFYDNVKLLAWFDVAGAVLTAGLLAGWSKRGALGRAAAALALFGCTASGALAVGHELTNDAFVMSHEDARMAALVRDHTPPDAVVATAASYHDPVALLSGRRVLLATPRMLPSHGIDPRARALEVVTLYAGGPAALEVIARHHVTAVVVGPHERRDLPRVDEAFLASQARQVLERDGQRLYLLGR